MKNSIVVTAPSVEPVTLTEAKTQLRILSSDTTYDVEIGRIITTARMWLELRLGIAFITQTRKQRQDNFYERYPLYRITSQRFYTRFPITLLYPPVQSITSFKYIDTTGTQQTLNTPADYSVGGLMSPTVGAQDVEIPRIYPTNMWPSFQWIPDAIEFVYVCGFGPDGTYVPAPIKQAMLMAITHFFENRAEEIVGERIEKFQMSIDRVTSMYEKFDHVNIYA